MISFFPFLQNRGKQGQDLSKNYVTILFFILMHENILNFSERPKSIFGPSHELCKKSFLQHIYVPAIVS